MLYSNKTDDDDGKTSENPKRISESVECTFNEDTTITRGLRRIAK